MWRWFLHVTGIDTQQSYYYDLWSGIGTQLTVLLAGIGAWHKHNCHGQWCPRIGKHVHEGTPYCRKHRPPTPAAAPAGAGRAVDPEPQETADQG